MGSPKFEVFKGTNSQYYFRLKAGNGEKILSSEGYTYKQNCLNGIDSVKKHASNDVLYERKDSFMNYTFNLKAGNGEKIGKSENYTSSHSRENGIRSVKENAGVARVEDLS